MSLISIQKALQEGHLYALHEVDQQLVYATPPLLQKIIHFVAVVFRLLFHVFDTQTIPLINRHLSQFQNQSDRELAKQINDDLANYRPSFADRCLKGTFSRAPISNIMEMLSQAVSSDDNHLLLMQELQNWNPKEEELRGAFRILLAAPRTVFIGRTLDLLGKKHDPTGHIFQCVRHEVSHIAQTPASNEPPPLPEQAVASSSNEQQVEASQNPHVVGTPPHRRLAAASSSNEEPAIEAGQYSHVVTMLSTLKRDFLNLLTALCATADLIEQDPTLDDKEERGQELRKLVENTQTLEWTEKPVPLHLQVILRSVCASLKEYKIDISLKFSEDLHPIDQMLPPLKKPAAFATFTEWNRDWAKMECNELLNRYALEFSCAKEPERWQPAIAILINMTRGHNTIPRFLETASVPKTFGGIIRQKIQNTLHHIPTQTEYFAALKAIAGNFGAKAEVLQLQLDIVNIFLTRHG
ncbi:MAG: hypothetical protein A3F09_02245 [Chlamydiae bacterium RIFCSPHIGHO2_12_FULL_49_11]|nr:MAG: hypothetical protein A3F09_02245 [Chlamydiae bacterium RIFCSPHIGHO2_12_FULL_49_11]